jgi:hypothetical protein
MKNDNDILASILISSPPIKKYMIMYVGMDCTTVHKLYFFHSSDRGLIHADAA